MAINFEQIIRDALHKSFVEQGLLPRETAAKSVPAMGMTGEENEEEKRRESDAVRALEAKGQWGIKANSESG